MKKQTTNKTCKTCEYLFVEKDLDTDTKDIVDVLWCRKFGNFGKIMDNYLACKMWERKNAR